MASSVIEGTFVEDVLKEVVWPAKDQLMETRYFTDLRNGKLTTRRLQGFSLEHTWFNWTLLKSTGLRMLTAPNLGALKANLFQVSEERTHPEICMKFGKSLGLTDEDFEHHIPTTETLTHTSIIVAGPMTSGNASAGRTSGMVNETLVQRYSTEFANYLTKPPYNLTDDDIEFFIIHGLVDVDHSRMAAEAVARGAKTDEDQAAVWRSARLQVKLKLAKFEGIYDAYA